MEASLQDLFAAVAAGLVCGFVVSVPVGPVNLAVINQALRRGFGPGFLVGLGAICAEMIYASVMLAGHASILDKPAVMTTMHVAALVVMVWVGLHYLLIKPDQIEAKSAAVAERVDERWHHPRAFLLGFILTISNWMLVLLWATLAAVLSRVSSFTRRGGQAACVAGVFVGGALWFWLLAFFVSRAHRRVKPKALAVLMQGCGAVLLVCAGLLAYRLLKA